MLVGFRNNILIGGLFFSLILFLLLLGGLYLFLTADFSLDRLAGLKSNTWWFTYKNQSSESMPVWAALGAALVLVFIIISSLILRILFKKTASPELFFYTIFLFSFSFESFRILNAFFYFSKAPVYLSLFSSRLVYFGRIFGILSLFCSSLYAVEIKYQKFNVLIGIAVVLALILAYSLPMDSTILLSNFLFQLGDEAGLFFLNFAFVFFIILNYLIAVIKRQRNFLSVLLAIAIVLTGREILFFAINPLLTSLSLLLIIGGTVLLSRQIDKIYLWF